MEYNEDPIKRTEEEPEGEEEQYSFLQETIKTNTMTRSKGIRKAIWIMLGGLLFGTCACLAFFAIKPWAESKFPGNADAVSIPNDEEVDEDTTDTPLQDEVAKVLNGENYRELLEKVDAIASEASKCVVAVQISEPNTEVTDQQSAQEATKSEAGIIVADNGQELLILTASVGLGNAENLKVVFDDQTKYTAALKKQDKNLGLAIVSISRSEIGSETWASIKTAMLGNSRILYQGDPVIALGNTYGYADGQGYGVISSNAYKAELNDGQYAILATDIATTEKGTGVLFNLQGEVVGIVMPGIWDNESGLLANAYAISDLKTTIELLSNGASVPYVGVQGTYITEEIANEQDIPQGVYVKQVAADSPAMAAGIQSGDIITRVGSIEITSFESYERAIINKTVGNSVKISGKRRGNNGYVDIEFNVKIGSLE